MAFAAPATFFFVLALPSFPAGPLVSSLRVRRLLADYGEANLIRWIEGLRKKIEIGREIERRFFVY